MHSADQSTSKLLTMPYKKLGASQNFLQESSNSNERNIFLYGVVGFDFNVNTIFRAIDQLPPEVTKLNFFMDSPGGFVSSGLTMLTNIRRLNSQFETTGFIDGMAASMMSGIAVSFSKTVASPTSEMMIHDVMFGLDAFGGFNRKQIRDLIAELSEQEQRLQTDAEVLAFPYAQKTGLTIDEVDAKWFADGKNHFLSPRDMLNEGLIDEVATEPLPKPDEIVELEEDELFAGVVSNTNSAGIDSPYRGLREKLFSGFAYNSINSDHKTASDSPHLKSNKPVMNFKEFAEALNLDPNSSKDAIVNVMRSKLTRLAELETKNETLQSLVDDKTNKINELTTKISTAEENMLTANAQSVVDEVKRTALKDTENREVNMHIDEKLKDLAVNHLKSKNAGDETMATNFKEHMLLLAKTNLIPIGDGGEGGDNPEGDRTINEDGMLTADRLKQAREEGVKAKAKAEARWNRKLNLN